MCTLYMHVKCMFWRFRFLLCFCGDENLDAESEIRGGRGAPKMSVESGVEKVAVSVPKSQGEKKRTYVM